MQSLSYGPVFVTLVDTVRILHCITNYTCQDILRFVFRESGLLVERVVGKGRCFNLAATLCVTQHFLDSQSSPIVLYDIPQKQEKSFGYK